MALNYTKLAETATRLISENGRSLTLARREAPPVASEPWDPGPIEPTLGADRFDTSGVFLQYSAKEREVSTIQENDQRVLIPASGAPDVVDAEWVLIDGGDEYSIINSRLMKPAATAIFYELQVRK